MIEKRLRDLWDSLQGKKPHFRNFLHEVRLKNLRGIDELRVTFEYPVSVIAGGNASGKSTVLFAAACAYKPPGARKQPLVPSALFPDYRPKIGEVRDKRPTVTIEFDYSTPEGRLPMRWRRSKGWNRSYFGHPSGKQPERDVYLRTLSNLSNPSEVRSVLSMSRLKTEAKSTPLNASQRDFAQQMLPFQYASVTRLSSGSKNMLFADQQGGAQYSELHMSSGERAILRLAQEIAQLENALVLIDEVEAGLHPWVQQVLMLQLQQLALINELQIIVTTHSSVVLDSVPPYGRIFLDRDETGKVSVQPSHRDLIQNALYGQSQDTLNLLCEDAVAEGILLGIFDYLQLRGNIRPGTVQIGRNTGAQEFPAHAKAFRKFNQLQNFVFVLDGDQRQGGAKRELEQEAGVDAQRVVFLPGPDAPEVWVWNRLHQVTARDAAPNLGVTAADLRQAMVQQDQIYDSASDTPAAIAKAKLQALADGLQQDAMAICRKLAQWETDQEDSELLPLVRELSRILQSWRAKLAG